QDQDRSSRYDLQCGDLIAFETKEVTQVDRTAGKVSREMARNDSCVILGRDRKGLHNVVVLGPGIGSPAPDRLAPGVGISFVLDDCVLRKATGDRVSITLIGSKVHRNGLGQIDGHDASSSFWNQRSVCWC